VGWQTINSGSNSSFEYLGNGNAPKVLFCPRTVGCLGAGNCCGLIKISDWSAVRVKAEKFEEVDFDNLVTEENLRQFLGYNISKDKRMITKRGAVKKRSDAPQSPRPVTKKRPSSRAEEIPEDVPLRKKRNIPPAASGVKRTSPRVFMAGTNTEEGSASFRGFVPEVSPTQGAGSLPPFVLRDESCSKADVVFCLPKYINNK